MGELRREFDLPEEDVDFLNNKGLPWETFIENEKIPYLLIHDYPITDGYNVNKTNVVLRLIGYPTSQIDMAFFKPSLVRNDKKMINRVSDLSIDGDIYQQWSRHRTSKNPWIPGEDDVESHLLMFKYLLKNEFTK